MTMTFHIYKVVKRIPGNRLISVFGSTPENSPFTVEYKPQTSVTPQIGMVFAFDSLLSVEYEWGAELNLPDTLIELWRCETTKKPIPCNIRVPIDIDWKKKSFWNNFPLSPEEDKLKGMRTPKGTVFCEDITLLERIK